jgi:hypothetical protein
LLVATEYPLNRVVSGSPVEPKMRRKCFRIQKYTNCFKEEESGGEERGVCWFVMSIVFSMK